MTTEQRSMTDICRSQDSSYLVKGVEMRTQATIHAKYLLVDDGCHRHAAEGIIEVLPQIDIVPASNFIIKAVDSVNGCNFVVPSQNEEILRILDLVGKEQAYCLQALIPDIYVVTQEEVIGFRRESARCKNAEEVVVLAMDTAADLYGSV